MEQRESWSINRLATELGIDRRSLARRLDGVKPNATGPKGEPLYALRDTLEALGERPIERRSSPPRPAHQGGGSPPDAFLLDRRGAISTMTGEEACSTFGWSWRDLAELIGWGVPFVKAGSQRSVRGWVFGFAHFGRSMASLADRVNAGDDLGHLPDTLRTLRGARPLCVPTGFREFEPVAERRAGASKPNGAAQDAEPGPAADRGTSETEDQA